MTIGKAAVAVILATVLGMAACTKQEITPRTNVAPSLVVEQFLHAANAAVSDPNSRQQALATLGRLFGTKSGPIAGRDPKADVERRMFAIASELRHSDYEVVSEESVPGRSDEATKLTVRLTQDDKKYDVPFTLVRYKGDSWLVEQIGIEVLTAPRN